MENEKYGECEDEAGAVCVKVDAADTKGGEKKPQPSEIKTFRASTIPLTASNICVQMQLARRVVSGVGRFVGELHRCLVKTHRGGG